MLAGTRRPEGHRTYMSIGYDQTRDRMEAKARGARFDHDVRCWYCPDDALLDRFREWCVPLDRAVPIDTPTYDITRARTLGARELDDGTWECPAGVDIAVLGEWVDHRLLFQARAEAAAKRPETEPETDSLPRLAPPPMPSKTCATGPATKDTWLNVPYEDRERVLALGAAWSQDMSRYLVPKGRDLEPFSDWLIPEALPDARLSDEQKEIVRHVARGEDVIVDACVGSGKTTTLQAICRRFRNSTHLRATTHGRALYLTYNQLLKNDARNSIITDGVEVENYHSFARRKLAENGITVDISQMVPTCLAHFDELDMDNYALLVIDEYQDMKEDFAEMVRRLRDRNPRMQVVMVGDMCQKLYDDTRLDVGEFLRTFLRAPTRLPLTESFRMPPDLAHELALTWGKRIVGVNLDCTVEHASPTQIVDFLATCEPSQVMCLGSRGHGLMTSVQNELEDKYADIYNKRTVWSSISESQGPRNVPSTAAIFTTFDGCKGMERDVVVVFDFTQSYWVSRTSKPDADESILRNVFCVAASRGKRRIIFCEYGDDDLTFATIREDLAEGGETPRTHFPIPISGAFDFRYQEDVERCYDLLDTTLETPKDDAKTLEYRHNDGLIDLSPCMGILAEASYFDGYDLDRQLDDTMAAHPERPPMRYEHRWSDEEKALTLTAFETDQMRYVRQVTRPLMTPLERDRMHERLATHLTPYEDVQRKCGITLTADGMTEELEGRCDVVKDGRVWELKLKSELAHMDFLQCATYLVAHGLDEGILWNIRDDEMWTVRVPDETAFMCAVATCVTRGRMDMAASKDAAITCRSDYDDEWD